MARRLRDLMITEVSSVDKGAGEGVKILLMKRDAQKDADVIDFTAVLKATRDARQVTDQGALVTKASTALAKTIGAILGDAQVTDKAAAIGEALGDFQEFVTGKTGKQETVMTPQEIEALVTKSVTAAVAPLQATIAKQADEIAFHKLTADEQKYCADQKMDDGAKKAFSGMTPEERAAKMKKSLDPVDELDAKIQKVVAPIVAENATLKKQLGALQDERELVGLEKRATEMGLTKADAPLLKKAYSGDAEAQVAIEKRMGEVRKARDEALRLGKAFDEIGGIGNSNVGADDPMVKMTTMAADLRKTEAGKALSEAQAFDKVFNDPANQELRKQIRSAELAKINKVAA